MSIKNYKMNYLIDVENPDDYVWYFSYGSNMLYERFMCYIAGGRFRNKDKYHEPCIDTSEPVAVIPFEIGHNMYFANLSSQWGKKGVSFLDITKEGFAYGVAYLITREQFEHIARQENNGAEPESCPGWYNSKLKIGESHGFDVVTVTNDRRLEMNEPDGEYLKVLKEGLRENYPDLSDNDIDEYLCRCAVSAIE